MYNSVIHDNNKNFMRGKEEMKRKLSLILAVILLASLFLSACGSTVETAQGVTENTVKVGNSIEIGRASCRVRV